MVNISLLMYHRVIAIIFLFDAFNQFKKLRYQFLALCNSNEFDFIDRINYNDLIIYII